MPNVTEVRNAFRVVLNMPAGRTMHLTHEMRQAGRLPNDGRGHPPAPLSAEQIAEMLIVSVLEGGLRTAAHNAREWLAATAHDGTQTTLGEALAQAVADPHHNVRAVHIDGHLPRAVIDFDGGRSVRFQAPRASGDRSGSNQPQCVRVISGGALSAIALAGRKTGGGWGRPQ
jgi:hypothetical protein